MKRDSLRLTIASLRRAAQVTTLFLVATGASASADNGGLSAQWIRSGLSHDSKPEKESVPLYWFEVRETPFAFRLEFTTDEDLESGVAVAQSSGYLYVFLDGTPVFEHVPKQEGSTSDESNENFSIIDLTAHLTPGRHALVVSAPSDGFALMGELHYTDRSVPLVTGGNWHVRQFPPTTILEDESWLKPGSATDGFEVEAGTPFTPDPDWASIRVQTKLARTLAAFDDALWRAELLAERGIFIVGGKSHSWGTPERLEAEVKLGARESLTELQALAEQADEFRIDPLGRSAANVDDFARQVSLWANEIEFLGRKQKLIDECKALSLASRAIPVHSVHYLSEETARMASGIPELVPLEDRVRRWRLELESHWKHPLNVLNESRFDRLGWLPHPELTESQLGGWGIRVNPVRAPGHLELDGKNWRFQTDSEKSGESEKRQTLGYNIENQWPQMAVPQSWTQTDKLKNYRGAAWYRLRFHVPQEWQGHPAILRFEAHDADTVWLNDLPVGETAQPGVRRYTVEPDRLRPGQENLLVIRVEGAGEQRGLTGSVTLACPAVAAQEQGAERVAVLSSPLSPVKILTPRDTALEIRGWQERQEDGPEVMVPLRQGAATVPVSVRQYHQNVDGPLKSNYVLLWFEPDEQSIYLPILLVLERPPLQIVRERDLVRLEFKEPDSRVLAVRPWTKLIPKRGEPRFASAVGFWRRAALAVPTEYMSLTRMIESGPEAGFPLQIGNVPPGPLLEQTVFYSYVEVQDAWGTLPLKIAPVPALASYGLDTGFPTLDIEATVQEIQDGGLLAPYRVAIGTDRIGYSYQVEPFPRLAGFTSWMFSPADTGVPGNEREVELIRSTGSNSYRPQHNFSTESSPYYPPEERRTRVEIMADFCNDHGLNYMNNIDQTLGGPREKVRQEYGAFMERVNRHYESIARQLADRAFPDVAYDLINEPFDHQHSAYNQAMRELTARIREIDSVHLLYIEPCEAWGAIEQLKLIEPTGDPLTVYSFHDYNFRLFKPSDRWPTLERDISHICRQWIDAFRFAIQHGTPMHCGEFGGFDNSTDNQLAQLVLMNDFLRLFDQFGMHFHYYSGRTVFGRRADGSMALSHVVRAYRDYFRSGNFNPYSQTER